VTRHVMDWLTFSIMGRAALHVGVFRRERDRADRRLARSMLRLSKQGNTGCRTWSPGCSACASG